MLFKFSIFVVVKYLQMKNKSLYIISLFISACVCLWVMNSCEPDNCKNVICPSNRTCYNGNCVCQNGLEGENCEINSVDRFIGNYDVNEYAYTGTTPAPFYTSPIQYGASSNEIWISNFSNTGITIRAFISTSTSTGKGTHISINDSNGVLEVSGEGEYNENLNRIDLQCNIKQEFQSRACQVTFIKI